VGEQETSKINYVKRKINHRNHCYILAHPMEGFADEIPRRKRQMTGINSMKNLIR
jgi:hypothetical protein